MKSLRCVIAFAFAAVCFCMTVAAQETEHPPHWGYSGEAGPEHWGEMDSDFAACSSGRNQSPVDLHSFIEADLPPIRFAYVPGGNEVVNNGHALQVNYDAGSSSMSTRPARTPSTADPSRWKRTWCTQMPKAIWRWWR